MVEKALVSLKNFTDRAISCNRLGTATQSNKQASNAKHKPEGNPPQSYVDTGKWSHVQGETS